MRGRTKVGLTLSGGGARGAYQAGVLRAIFDICRFKESPFQVISGISAGAVNGMAIAAGADDFERATQMIWDTWTSLTMHKIFKTDTPSLLKIASSWLVNVSMGSLLGSKKTTYLLDHSPLRQLVAEKIDTRMIAEHIRGGRLHAVGMSATDYRSGKSVTFFDGDPEVEKWDRFSGIGRRTELTVDHIMASSSIPLIFPPVRIERSDYGDGGIGLSTPLNPAIRLGADRILVIGLEYPPGHEEEESIPCPDPVTLGDIAGTLLNALFLKSLDSDIFRLEQTNRLLAAYTADQLQGFDLNLRKVPALFIRPSRDLGRIDTDQFARFPLTLRHLLKGLGIEDSRAWALLSYLAFESEYAYALLQLGYRDGLSKRQDIKEFFEIV